MVGPGLGNGGDDDDGDDVTSVAVSEDTISVGSGYTVRPEEEDDKSASFGGSGRTGMDLGRSLLLGGLTKSAYFDDAPSAESSAVKLLSGGIGGEKRTLSSSIYPSSQYVTPMGRFNAKRHKVDEPRTDWSGLDPNLLHDVFSRLNLREKVRCMGKVCRAWNKLRSRPGLFADLSDESGPNAEDMDFLLYRWLPESAAPKLTGIRLNVLSCEDKSRATCLICNINLQIKKIVLSGPGWVAT